MTVKRGLMVAWAGVVTFAALDLHAWVFPRRETNLHIVREIGLFGYALYDLTTTAWHALVDDIDAVDAAPYRNFLQSRRETYRPRTAAAPEKSKKNVVFLQHESMDAMTQDAKLDGEWVMPFYRGLRERAWVMENALDQTSVGRSSDCHVLVLTSQIPIQNEPIFTREDLSTIPSLPRVLHDHGYHSLSMEGYQGEFWRWKLNHQRLGVDRSYDMTELDDSDMLGWGISDLSMVEQAVKLAAKSPRPFFAHVLMLTNHHPFEFVRESLGVPSGGIVRDYLVSVRYVDTVIQRFYQRLAEAGLADSTIVAVYADHDSGITEELAQYLGRDYRPGAENERIPWMMTGLGAPRTVTRPAGLADLAPTILDAVGLPIPEAFVGIPISVERGDVLLPNGTHVTKIEGDLPTVESLAIDVKTLTRLAIHRSSALCGPP